MPPRFRTAASLALALGFAVLLGPAAAQQNPPVSRIAFGSCADEEKPQPLWDAVLAYHPDLFVFTGDNVYGDVHRGRDVAEGEVLAELRESYAEARSVAGFMRLVNQRRRHLFARRHARRSLVRGRGRICPWLE